MYPDSYPGDVGEEMNSPELKLSSDALRASLTLSGDIFSHGLGAASLETTATDFSSLVDGSDDFF